ncbi:hypothetical protein MORTIMER_288 [Erwinia phage vB_EamM_Mortimer]|uniref:Uncharacterized protein n=1 Tax=Erwinia phage vB_EamM_Mortimer TaxID=2060129 RepID=A0A2H5BL26_9CAUD|nr:hypothetical protein MORTIMER_288 [Erwinia phage vB_EamM_Mortimer]
MSEANQNIVESYDDLPKNAQKGDRYTVREDAIVYELQEDGSWKDVDINEQVDQENEEQAQTEDGQQSDTGATDQPASDEEGDADSSKTAATDEENQVDDNGNDKQTPAEEKQEEAAQAVDETQPRDDPYVRGANSDANPAQPEDANQTQDQTDEAGQTPDSSDDANAQQESTDGVATQDAKEQANIPEGVDPEEAQPDNQPLAVAPVEQPPVQHEAVAVDPNADQPSPEARPDSKIEEAAELNAQKEDAARDEIAEAGADAQAATSAEQTDAGKAKEDAQAEGQLPNDGAADDVAAGKPRNDQTYTEDQKAANTPAPEIVQAQENHTSEPDPVVSQEETHVQNATDPDQPTIIPQEAKSESLAHQAADPTQETVFVKQDENLDPEVRVLQQRIEEYIGNMGVNGKHDRRDGPKYQARLYKDLHSIMALEPVKFKQVMDYLLNRVYEERAGAFSDTYTRRYFDQLSPMHMQTDRVREFDNILSLVTTVGHSKNRSRALQQVDLQRALKNIQDAGKQQRMAAYFDALR